MFFEAIFEPAEKVIYNDEAQKLAGKTVAIQDGWEIDKGPHKGEHGFYIPNSTVGLIPKSDLKELKPVPIVRWKEIHKNLGLES